MDKRVRPIVSPAVLKMGDDRPFACPAPGCGQRFTNEDHLAVHKHKHEMTLKFGPGRDGVIVADQTPTPTRFLKNCEEVGLFTELASPFENDFKKVDDDEGKKSPLDVNLPSIPEVKIKEEDRTSQGSGYPIKSGNHPPISDGDGKDQTLKRPGNTAHTFVRPVSLLLNYESVPSLHPTLPSPTSVITPTPPSNRALLSPTGSLPMLLHLPIGQTMPVNIPSPTVQLPTVISIARPAPIISNVPGIPGPTSNTSDPQSPTLPPNHLETRMRLKSALTLQSHSLMNGNVMGSVMTTQQRETTGPLPVTLSPPLPQTSPSQLTSSGAVGRRRRGAEEDPDERRQRFLERNRAAASRCRQKRKVWVSSLEKKAEELGHMNVQLQNEVRLLRSEVAQLKQLLLAHRDCPVTTIQKRTQDFIDNSPQEMCDPLSDPVGVIQRPSGGGRSTAETLASSALAQMAAAPPHPHIRSPHSHLADR